MLLMLHTKYCGNQPTGSGKKRFEGFLQYKGVGAILVANKNFNHTTQGGSA